MSDIKTRFTESDVMAALTKAAAIFGVNGAIGLVVQYGYTDSISRLSPAHYEAVILACERVASGKPPGETVH